MPADNAGGYAKVWRPAGDGSTSLKSMLYICTFQNCPISMYRIIVLGISFLLIFSFSGIAQTDTVYYDRDWNQTDFSSADICRTLNVKGDKVTVEDRYFSKGIDTEHYHRPVNIKYPHYSYASYTQKGMVLEAGEYEENKETGKWIDYYANTTSVWCESNYSKGKEVGELLSYYRSGKLKRREIYKKDDTTVTGTCYDEMGNEIMFTPFMTQPRPLFKLEKLLAQNLHYPENARERNIEGKVVVSFVVNTDGTVSDVKAIQRIGGGCDEEAVRVMSLMSKWTPGTIDGQISKIHFRQPISFKLE